MQIGLLLVASAAANSCGNPNEAFANSFSQNLKGEVCTNFGAKKYCYVECLAGYNQLAPIETKRTKITCSCDSAGCSWIPSKPEF